MVSRLLVSKGGRDGFSAGQVVGLLITASAWSVALCQAPAAPADGVCLLQRKKQAAAVATVSEEAPNSSAQAPLGLPTLVINLDSRPDRWNNMVDRLEALMRSGLLQPRHFRATDAAKENISTDLVRHSWRTHRNAEYVGLFYVRSRLNLSDSERACAHSHVRAWQEIARQQVDQPTLVLEDDAVLSEDFADRLPQLLWQLQSNASADMLYIGYSEAESLTEKVGDGLYRAPYLWTTIGYVLWPSAARKLLTMLPIDQPVDNFIAWQVKNGRLQAFAASPKLVEPEHSWDVLSDVQHSDELGTWEYLKALVSSPFKAIGRTLGMR